MSVKAIVIDASVALKWRLRDEEATVQADALLDDFLAGNLALLTPTLFDYEIANALRMAVIRQRLSEQESVAALNDFSQYPITRYEFPSLSMRTLQLSGEHQRSAYDSAYLALAESQGVWFFTGDKRLFNALGQTLEWVKWDWRLPIRCRAGSDNWPSMSLRVAALNCHKENPTMTHRHDPDGKRLPIKMDSTSNGEFAPMPLTARQREANRLAREYATDNARRAGMGRRAFLVSACGAASTLLAFNVVNASAGKTGGTFELTAEAAVDPEAAAQALDGKEFIFDVQGHFIGEAALRPGSPRGPKNFIKDVFLDSDTDMMVLSFVPSRRDSEPLTIREADAVRQIVDNLDGSHRLLLHGRVNPNQAGDVEGMDELAERWGVSAWKTYTQWGPDGRGYFLSDPDTGVPFIEKARSLGVKVICIHKGIPFGGRSYEHSLCDDVGVAARQFPDVSFIIYHSGWVPGQPERAYEPNANRDGVDSLIRSLLDNGVPPNSNVYAELGSTWRGVMGDPDSAAHCLGKLFKYVGENNVLWGTDSIWYGSPQDQIQAFRTFQITPEFQERYGYPAITPALRAKVFGLNATRPYRISADEVLKRAGRDAIADRRLAYAESPNPHFLTFGPKTRREFDRLVRLHGGVV